MTFICRECAERYGRLTMLARFEHRFDDGADRFELPCGICGARWQKLTYPEDCGMSDQECQDEKRKRNNE